MNKSERNFKTLAENAPYMVVRFDRDIYPVYIEEKILKDLGVPIDVLIHKPLSEWGMSKEETQRLEEAVRWVFRTKSEKLRFVI